MTEIDIIVGFLTGAFWIFSILLIYILSSRRIKKVIVKKWNPRMPIKTVIPRPALMTVMRMYSSVKQSTSEELTIMVRNEMTTNAALVFDKPLAFFIRLGREPLKLQEFFKSKELVYFFTRPKLWSRLNGGTQRLMFGLVVRNEATEKYMEKLARMIELFERDITFRK